jgi:hypothetical protein
MSTKMVCGTLWTLLHKAQAEGNWRSSSEDMQYKFFPNRLLENVFRTASKGRPLGMSRKSEEGIMDTGFASVASLADVWYQ